MSATASSQSTATYEGGTPAERAFIADPANWTMEGLATLRRGEVGDHGREEIVLNGESMAAIPEALPPEGSLPTADGGDGPQEPRFVLSESSSTLRHTVTYAVNDLQAALADLADQLSREGWSRQQVPEGTHAWAWIDEDRRVTEATWRDGGSTLDVVTAGPS
ncbi:hypothetical protein [Demequina sp. NBRC 110057]|uniref:hypothetical protein n=1 Tax=Demequina sp. NBRC 110057 TaxID=1570346 RepID=UPI0011784463|nr:hypothetical protein [Demequina sp. NBRC 110057]